MNGIRAILTLFLVAASLAACGSSTPFPHQRGEGRTGADRTAPVSASLPPPPAQAIHDQGVASVDPAAGVPIGSRVAASAKAPADGKQEDVRAGDRSQ